MGLAQYTTIDRSFKNGYSGSNPSFVGHDNLRSDLVGDALIPS